MSNDAAQSSPPPRPVPGPLKIRVLFGGFLSQFGWLFCAFGMVFVLVFDPGAGVAELFAFRAGTETIEGRTTGYDATSLSINDVRVYETTYSFDHPDAGTVHGVSDETGSWVEPGQRVSVEYARSDPARSRIAGMRSNPGGLGTVFIFIFPAVGLTLGLVGFRTGRRRVELLSNGLVTRGTLLTSERTNTRVNNRPVMRLTFEFEADNGATYQTVAKTHQPWGLEDEARELLVYDSRDPSRASMLDVLPCQPRFDERGNLEASLPGLPSAVYLLLPGLSALTMLRYLSGFLGGA
jgi:hypothetical protein